MYKNNANVYSVTSKKNYEVSQSLQVQVLQHNFLLRTAARKTSIVNGREHQCTLDTGHETKDEKCVVKNITSKFICINQMWLKPWLVSCMQLLFINAACRKDYQSDFYR
jgi:hypothetical protein